MDSMIVIIGAGPAGLSIAYHAQRRRLDYVVLEKAQVGNSWAHHYDSLTLHTLKAVSALPGLPHSAETPQFLTRDHLHRYLQAYVTHFQLNVRTETPVTRLSYDQSQAGAKWRVETEDGVISAEKVVLATGIWSKPFAPTFTDQAMFRGDILHSNSYKNPAPFVGKRVLTVGVGNTGADIAVELAEAGAASSVAVKVGADFVPYPTSAFAMKAAATAFRVLPDAIGNRVLSRPNFADIGIPGNPLPPVQAYPVVGFKLPDAVKRGDVRALPGIERFYEDGVIFENGERVAFDAVVLATGYRPALDFLDDDLVSFNNRGWVEFDADYRSTQHRSLFLAGYAYPATSGWIQNMQRVARKIGRNL